MAFGGRSWISKFGFLKNHVFCCSCQMQKKSFVSYNVSANQTKIILLQFSNRYLSSNNSLPVKTVLRATGDFIAPLRRRRRLKKIVKDANVIIARSGSSSRDNAHTKNLLKFHFLFHKIIRLLCYRSSWLVGENSNSKDRKKEQHEGKRARDCQRTKPPSAR